MTPKISFTNEELATEKWLPVVGYEGWYEVSSLGRVRRVMPGIGTQPGIVLKPSCRGSHPNNMENCVNLHKNGERHKIGIHRLVMDAFVGPRPDGQEVNHKDTNRSNNRLINLEYCTPKQNRRHAIRMGCLDRHGEKCHFAKLTMAQVIEIKKRLESGCRGIDLAYEFNVSTSTICGIKHRRTWVKFPVQIPLRKREAISALDVES